ncbi:MAG: hypothetical protein AAB215_03065 [Planctomycetota bacterium]
MRRFGLFLGATMACVSLSLFVPETGSGAEKKAGAKKKKGAPPAKKGGEPIPGITPPPEGGETAPPPAGGDAAPAGGGASKGEFSSFKGQFFSTNPTPEQCKVLLEKFEPALVDLLNEEQTASYKASVGTAAVANYRDEATRRLGIIESLDLDDNQYGPLRQQLEDIVRSLLTNDQLKSIGLLTINPPPIDAPAAPMAIPTAPPAGVGGDATPPPAGGETKAKPPAKKKGKGKGAPAKGKSGGDAGGEGKAKGGDAGGGDAPPAGGDEGGGDGA